MRYGVVTLCGESADGPPVTKTSWSSQLRGGGAMSNEALERFLQTREEKGTNAADGELVLLDENGEHTEKQSEGEPDKALKNERIVPGEALGAESEGDEEDKEGTEGGAREDLVEEVYVEVDAFHAGGGQGDEERGSKDACHRLSISSI
jgi:hypothetical protein